MDETWLSACLAALALSIDEALTIVNATGTVIEWNDAAERLYGIPRNRILGKQISAFFPKTSLVVHKVLETGESVESTYHEPAPDIHVLITARAIVRDGQVAGALAVERDITRTVEMSRELMAAKERVAVLEKALQSRSTTSLAPPPDPFEAIIGRHPSLLRSISLARRVAPTDANVLIYGETGVGKELFAQGLHLASMRARGPFVALNCGALPSTLFESELFGYAPGAFTGANPKGQPGKLEIADGGTLFLDEVGELNLESQVKLLRFLEDRRFFRVGGATPVAVTVRILAATNRSLEEMVSAGTFRSDLYWRLNVVSIELPPLRQRKEDIVDLVQAFLREFSVQYGREITRVDPEVMQALLHHPWPGNVRALRNTVQRLVVLADDDTIRTEHLPDAIRNTEVVRAPALNEPEEPGRSTGGLQAAVSLTEREQILQALREAGGNRKRAAELLGISRGTLYNKCRQLGIPL